MLFRLHHAFATALRIRRLGMIHGEALAWYYGEEGFRGAVEAIGREKPGSPERMLAIWTARFARRRLDALRASDPAGRHRLEAAWRHRSGSLMAEEKTLDELLAFH